MSLKSRSKAHTKYYLKDGTIVKGATTITRIEGGDKTNALCKWANNLGLEDISYDSFMANVSNLGTLSHYLCECEMKGKKPNLKDYTENEIKEAQIPLKKFKEWINEQKEFQPILVEECLVSEEHKFGGTIDLYAKLNGKRTLIDLKTSNACREEHKVQVAAYRQLLIENDYMVEDVKILRIGRKKSEGYQIVNVGNLDIRWQKFLLLKGIYDINRRLYTR